MCVFSFVVIRVQEVSLFVKYFRGENIGLQRRLLGEGAECGRKAFCWMEWGLGGREA